jgi:hypothetical protein
MHDGKKVAKMEVMVVMNVMVFVVTLVLMAL